MCLRRMQRACGDVLEGVAARLAEDTSVCALRLLVYEALSY